MLIHSENIKTMLMYYFRFKRQQPCVDEVDTDCRESADMLVIGKKHIIEIEIKTSKSDLIGGERRKAKHKKPDIERIVNKYFVCVPTELVEDAKKWIEETNPKYGLIEFVSNASLEKYLSYERYIHFVKNASVLQPKIYSCFQERLVRRLSSALINERLRRVN